MFIKRKRSHIDIHRLIRVAKKHGVFILDGGRSISFIDEATGKSLGVWHSRPYHRFVVKHVQQKGSPFDALRTIIEPYDL